MKVVNAPVEHLDPGATATFQTTFEPSDQAVGVAVTFVVEPPKKSSVPAVHTEKAPEVQTLPAPAVTKRASTPRPAHRTIVRERAMRPAPVRDCFMFNGQQYCN